MSTIVDETTLSSSISHASTEIIPYPSLFVPNVAYPPKKEPLCLGIGDFSNAHNENHPSPSWKKTNPTIRQSSRCETFTKHISSDWVAFHTTMSCRGCTGDSRS